MDYEETIQKWLGGDLTIPDPLPKYKHDLRDQLQEQVGGSRAYRMIKMFQPAPSEEKGPVMIAIWESLEKRSRDVRKRMRPGKAFGKMFPWLDKVELASSATGIGRCT